MEGGNFRFLDLPAELRNDIYRILYPNASVRLTLATPAFLSSRTAEQCYEFCPLAHTSQQLRREVLPIYHVGIMPFIRLTDQREFVHLLYTSQSMRNVMQSITLNEFHRNGPVDVYPLLEIMKSTPKGKINVVNEVTRTYSGQETDSTMLTQINPTLDASVKRFASILNNLIAPRTSYRTKKWGAFFDQHVKQIWISFSPRAQIRVVVGKKAEEWWMGSENVCDKMPGMSQWMEKVGFPGKTGRELNGGTINISTAWVVEVAVLR